MTASIGAFGRGRERLRDLPATRLRREGGAGAGPVDPAGNESNHPKRPLPPCP